MVPLYCCQEVLERVLERVCQKEKKKRVCQRVSEGARMSYLYLVALFVGDGDAAYPSPLSLLKKGLTVY